MCNRLTCCAGSRAAAAVMVALLYMAILGIASRASAQDRLPTLTIDPPQNFLRSPASGANVDWYDSTIASVSFRIYPFRPFAGDLERVFRETLLRDWTPLDPVVGLAGPPVVDRVTMERADAVLTARFLDMNGRSHYRVAILAHGGRAVAIVHVKGETPSAYDAVLPSTIKVLTSMRITTELPRLSTGTPGADPRAVSGLYMTPRLKMVSAVGSVASTYFYLFSQDGRVYRGYGLLPSAPGGDILRFDYAAAAQGDPENAGTFEVQGTRVVISMGWQHPYTITTMIPDRDGKITIENSTFTRQLR